MNFLDKSLNEWYKIIRPIIIHPEFQKRKNYMHHGTISVYDHVLCVSLLAYKMALKKGLNVNDASIAGLLHDFYKKPWMEDDEKKPFFKKHGFTHARDAVENSKTYFKDYLNPTIESAMLTHMFPLNIKPPQNKIGWIITIADKKVSLECFHEVSFFKALFKGVVR